MAQGNSLPALEEVAVLDEDTVTENLQVPPGVVLQKLHLAHRPSRLRAALHLHNHNSFP